MRVRLELQLLLFVLVRSMFQAPAPWPQLLRLWLFQLRALTFLPIGRFEVFGLCHFAALRGLGVQGKRAYSRVRGLDG